MAGAFELKRRLYQYNHSMLPDCERLPTEVYSVAQVRAMDRATIDEHGVAGYTLMQRAAAAALRDVSLHWPGTQHLHIYCGHGNNAGDGYVLARLAQSAGIETTVVHCAPPQALTGDAALAWRDCAAAGVAAEAFDPAATLPRQAVLVDALFGTGLSRPLEGTFAAAVEQMTASGHPVLALDIPSGVDADSGLVGGPAVRAQRTIGFVGLKTGYFLGVGPAHCGALGFADLEIPAAVRLQHRPCMQRLGLDAIAAALPRRARLAHKGDCGRLLLIAGAPGMAGAARLAGEAALRAGAGLVYVVTHRHHAAAIAGARPELIVYGVDSAAELAALNLRCDAIALGPGLGRTRWADAMCRWTFAQSCPLVVDADALNWLSHNPARVGQREAWILTPHPGEAGRLLGTSAAAVQRDRRAAVAELAAKYAATVVLKGACTLVAGAEGDPATRVCLAGNPGMASAGMGDVLTGVIAGILVQCGSVTAAADAGVLVHALAGDTAAAAHGERGLLAGDLFEAIRAWANPS